MAIQSSIITFSKHPDCKNTKFEDVSGTHSMINADDSNAPCQQDHMMGCPELLRFKVNAVASPISMIQ